MIVSIFYRNFCSIGVVIALSLHLGMAQSGKAPANGIEVAYKAFGDSTDEPIFLI